MSAQPGKTAIEALVAVVIALVVTPAAAEERTYKLVNKDDPNQAVFLKCSTPAPRESSLAWFEKNCEKADGTTEHFFTIEFSGGRIN